MIRKNAPHVKWIVSFADACQCGDGTIYRASNFVLTGITKNKTIMRMPDGSTVAALSLEADPTGEGSRKAARLCNVPVKYRTRTEWAKLGLEFVDGYMLRYIYFIDKASRSKLTVPIIPFSKIDELGIGMYRGKKKTEQDDTVVRGRCCGDTSSFQEGEGGSIPTTSHHST